MKVLPIQCLAVMASVILVSCGQENVTPFTLAELPEKRVVLEKEWRDALRLPVAEVSELSLGEIPKDGAVRFGVMALSDSQPGTVEVFAGDRRIARQDADSMDGWTDARIDLSAHAGSSLRLRFSNLSGGWIGPCEVVDPSVDAGPNVLVFLIDTLRKDRLGCYGYEPDTSPHIDAFADDGVLVSEMVPQSSWTRPSVASILTSTYPDVHGAQDWPDVMRSGLPTLAGTLASAGYETHALIGNPQVLPTWGMGHEFSRCVDVNATLEGGTDDADLVQAAKRTIAHAAGRPWFLYVHVLGPHDPYDPPEPFRSRFAGDDGDASARYDGEIAYTDAQFGDLVQFLKESGAYDNTLLVVTSDHGEEFGEHGGEYHGHTLYEEMLDVPLIVKLPESAHAGTRCEGIVEGVDIAPTIVDLLGIPAEPRFQGTSFAPWLRGDVIEARTAYTSLFRHAYAMRGAKREQRKYLKDYVSGKETWFDLATDPKELNPIETAEDTGLARHVARMAAKGAAGFHLLITRGEADFELRGTVSIDGAGPAELRYYDSKYTLQQDGDTIQFQIKLHDEMDAWKKRDEWHAVHAEQAHAHLYVPMTKDAPISITLAQEGAPSALAHFRDAKTGNLRTLDSFDGTFILLEELLAPADAFDPAALPREFGVYAWYVADVDTIARSDLDPAMENALESLGYLD